MKIIFCDIILTLNHLKKKFLKTLNLFEKWVFVYRRHLNTKIYSIFIYKYEIFSELKNQIMWLNYYQFIYGYNNIIQVMT